MGELNNLNGQIHVVWVGIGDFNCVMNVKERIVIPVTMVEVREFR